MELKTNAIKLNNIKSYNNSSSRANEVFKNKFYSEYKKVNYSQYEDIDYNSIDLGKGIENSKQKEDDKSFSGAGAYLATFVFSIVEGIVDVAETVVDGTVQIVGGAISYAVGAIDKEAGKAMQEGIQNFVSYDASEAMYDEFVSAAGIDEDIAYGWAHTAGKFTGQVLGYVGISMIPGGAVVTATAGGLSAAGAAAENAYANGATFDEAMITSTVAGITAAGAGGAMNKLGTSANTATSLKAVAGYTLFGSTLGAAEPIINSGVEYITYGNNDGQSYFEYMDESGGWYNVALGTSAGSLNIGGKALKTYKNVPKRNALINFKNDPEVKSWNSKKEFAKKVKKADKLAKYYSKNGVMDEKTFYDVWGAPKGSKPDPSTYLPPEYIDKHLSKFTNGGSRITAYDDFIKFKHATNGSGVPMEYNTGNYKYKNGSDFISTKDQIDSIIDKANKSSNKVNSICDDLGLGEDEKIKFSHGMKRYDIDGNELAKLNPRITSGNEPGAFKLDWVPGGNTLGGSPEIVIDSYKFNDNTIKYRNIE